MLLAFLDGRKNNLDDLIEWKGGSDEESEADSDGYSEGSSTDKDDGEAKPGDGAMGSDSQAVGEPVKTKRKKKKKDSGGEKNLKKKKKKKKTNVGLESPGGASSRTAKIDPHELHDMVHGSGEEEGPIDLTLEQRVKEFMLNHILILWVLSFYIAHVYIWWELEHEAGWTWVKTVYFTTASLTTVGYGDIAPEDNFGRLYCVFFILVGLACVTSVFTGLMDDFLHQVEVVFIGKGDSVGQKIKQNIDAEEYYQPNAFIRYRKIVFSACVIFATIISGVIYMMVTHEWDFVKSLYWCVVTATTVGYGDVDYEHDQLTLLFMSFYMLFSTMAVAVALSNFVKISREVEVELHQRTRLDGVDVMDLLREPKYGFTALYKKVHDREMTMSTKGLATPLKRNPKLHLGKISKLDFVLFMIEKLHGLDREGDMNPILNKFDDHDKEETGYLDVQELLLFAEAVARKRELRIASEEKKKRDTHILSKCHTILALMGLVAPAEQPHVTVEDIVTSNAPRHVVSSSQIDVGDLGSLEKGGEAGLDF